jgi:hypothetical protein
VEIIGTLARMHLKPMTRAADAAVRRRAFHHACCLLL